MNTTTKASLTGIIFGIIAGGITAFVVVGSIVVIIWSKPDVLRNWLGVEADVVTVNDSGTAAELTSDEAKVVAVVQQASPAVVSIVATKDVPIYEQYFEDYSDPFGFQIPQYRQKGTEEQEVSSGSGFLVSGDGYIVTNKHVVEDDTADYTAYTSDGVKHAAAVVAIDPTNDIAILKIDGEQFSFIDFADSDQLQVGQSVIAIGNALGEFSNSVSVGVVSGLARSIEAGDGYGQSEELEGVIQTDAAINFGNSGGPLLNLQGQAVGMNVAVAVGTENIGFALPGNLVKGVVESVQTTGQIVRPYLGVRYLEINQALKEKNSLSVDYGVLVQRGPEVGDLAVLPGSPADKAGIEENDIILEIDGQKLDQDHSLANTIKQKQVGDTVTLQVLHDGVEQEVIITLEQLPE